MSQLVSQNEPELKGKLVLRRQVSFVLKKLEDEIHKNKERQRWLFFKS